MADRVPELLSLGMDDRRLARLPGLFTELMEDVENLRVGLTTGLTTEEYRTLRDYHSRIRSMCEELAGYNVPETLIHEEVHDVNILVGDAGYIVTDWIDRSVSHPFFSMLVTIRAAAYRLELAEDGPEMRQLRDAYLETWTRFEMPKRLSAAFDLACRLGAINRAIS